MVMATSTPAAACAGEGAARAPRLTRGLVRSSVRSHTTTSLPASSRRVAIGVPMSPRPRNAILDMRIPLRSVDGLHAFGVRPPHGNGVGQDPIDLLQLLLRQVNLRRRRACLQVRWPPGSDD